MTDDPLTPTTEPNLITAFDYWRLPSGGLMDANDRREEFLGTDASSQATIRSWRCFGCDKVFTDEISARIHFGADGPACMRSEPLLLGHLQQCQHNLEVSQADRQRLQEELVNLDATARELLNNARAQVARLSADTQALREERDRLQHTLAEQLSGVREGNMPAARELVQTWIAEDQAAEARAERAEAALKQLQTQLTELARWWRVRHADRDIPRWETCADDLEGVLRTWEPHT